MVFETVIPGWNTQFILFNFRWPEIMCELTQDCNILQTACHGDLRVVPEGMYPRCIAVTQCNTGLIFRQFIFDGVVKSPLRRHSRAGGNPEGVEITRSKSEFIPWFLRVLISRLCGNDGRAKYLSFSCLSWLGCAQMGTGGNGEEKTDNISD